VVTVGSILTLSAVLIAPLRAIAQIKVIDFYGVRNVSHDDRETIRASRLFRDL
jgi:hypothetical protein